MVKTTLEIRESTFRRAKAVAAAQGLTLKELVNRAIEEKIGRTNPEGQPPWMKFAGQFGKTPASRAETERIQNRIDAEFEMLESEQLS